MFEGQGLLSMRHNPLKYDRYFEALRDAVGNEIVSPDGRYRIELTVEATPAAVKPLPPGEFSTASNPKRLGAFEVFLVPWPPDVSCGLFASYLIISCSH